VREQGGEALLQHAPQRLTACLPLLLRLLCLLCLRLLRTLHLHLPLALLMLLGVGVLGVGQEQGAHVVAKYIQKGLDSCVEGNVPSLGLSREGCKGCVGVVGWLGGWVGGWVGGYSV
jgi:hypothetical protein